MTNWMTLYIECFDSERMREFTQAYNASNQRIIRLPDNAAEGFRDLVIEPMTHNEFKEALIAYKDGALIQKAFPKLDADARETIIWWDRTNAGEDGISLKDWMDTFK